MPRPRKPGAPEPKKRSRNGCWTCKARKVKCDEGRPKCQNCQKMGEACDYSIRLNWDGNRKSKKLLDTIGLDQASPSIISTMSTTSGSDNSSVATPTSQPGSSLADPGFQASPVVMSPVSTTCSSSESPHHASAAAMSSTMTSRLGFLQESRPAFPVQGDNMFGPGLMTPASRELQNLLVTDAALRSPAFGLSAGESGPDSIPTVATGRAPKRLKLDAEPGDTADCSWTVSPAALTLTPRHITSAPLSEGSPYTQGGSGSGSGSVSGNGEGGGSPKSEEGQPKSSSRQHNQHPHHPTSDFRRLSVSSLLSAPSDIITSQEERLREATGSYLRLDTRTEYCRSTTYYGVDRGFRDLDLGNNDDINALSGSSPKLPRSHLSFDSSGSDDEEAHLEFGFGVRADDFERHSGGYYDRPVVVRISRTLEPLPAKLTENPMNILYFHHFINHTARVLVPHDDPKSNPFRTILPQMAVKNDNLLSLLLAYSASHRARLLQQPEPAMRIATWVQDIFPALRHALDHPTKKISNANVATAIMLASLEIVSPTAFGYNIPWQKHLVLARELIKARPEGLRVEEEDNPQEFQVCAFLWSWFAYIDVLGSLSGGPKDASSAWILDYKVYDPDQDDEIDCIMGFTTRCIYMLAKIAELARQCDAQRIRPPDDADESPGDPDPGTPGSNRRHHRVRADWRPSPETVARARELEEGVRASMEVNPRPCGHIHRTGDVARWDRREMLATNEAYHWAALAHLHRRVLAKPSDHPDVQDAVRAIIRCLQSVRRGGTAEACLLFPMFTAGCDTRDEYARTHILSRMMTVESTGMTQVHRARRLMQTVWESGQPFETLLSTEFIG